MRIIGIGELSWNLLYILAASLLHVANLYCKINAGEIWDIHLIIRAFYTYMGQTIIGLLSLINFTKKPTKGEQEEVPLNISGFEKIKLRNENIKWYLFFALKSFFVNILYHLSNYTNFGVVIWGSISFQVLSIILLSILCYYFLNYHYHMHHFVSFIIILIGFGLIVLANYDQFQNIILFFMTMAATLLQSSGEVLDKWLMDTKHFTPYRIVLVEGIMNMITTVIVISFIQFLPCLDDYAEIQWCVKGQPFESFASFNIILSDTWPYTILMMFCFGFFILLRKIIIFHYTPTHKDISHILASLIYWLTLPSFYTIQSKLDQICLILGCTIMLIGFLFYNEVLIIHVCDIGKNTRKETLERGYSEENNNRDSNCQVINEMNLSLGLNMKIDNDDINNNDTFELKNKE